MASRILRYAIGLIIVALILANLSIFTVRAGQVAVVTHFGRVDKVITEPGWYPKWFWPIDEAHRFDARRRVYTPKPQETLSRDRRNIIPYPYVVWSIDEEPAGPGQKAPAQRFMESLRASKGSDQAMRDAEEKLYSIVIDGQNAVLGSYDLDALLSSNPERLRIDAIEKEIVQVVQPRCRELGIRIHQFGFERLALPENTVKPALDRMMTARTEEAYGYRSGGELAARRIHSQTQLRIEEIRSEAAGRAAAIRGKGDADAARILLEAHSLDPAFYAWLRSLEGLKRMCSPKTSLVVSTRSPIFEALAQPQVPGGTPMVPATRPAPAAAGSSAPGSRP
jgi:membrane protease subunit HflC